MSTRSIQPRRQRKAVFTANHQERRRRMSVALSHELRTKYGRRSLPVRKGDTVRVLAGSYSTVGEERRVARVDREHYRLTLDNVTTKTADAKLKPLPIRPSHLVLTKLNLSDPWRRRVLKVPEAEVEPEDAEASNEKPTSAALPKAEAKP
ncbi:MAG TPA: 50S ribosomal protein L24 [Thermoplasmata archaeon]|nr:50S ribosomal protein L24 [Thermoplasmata archaeon]